MSRQKKSLKHNFSFINWGEATKQWFKGVKKQYTTLFPKVSKQTHILAGIKVKLTDTNKLSSSLGSHSDSSGCDLDSDYGGNNNDNGSDNKDDGDNKDSQPQAGNDKDGQLQASDNEDSQFQAGDEDGQPQVEGDDKLDGVQPQPGQGDDSASNGKVQDEGGNTEEELDYEMLETHSTSKHAVNWTQSSLKYLGSQSQRERTSQVY